MATQYGDFFYNGEPAIWLGIQAEAKRDYLKIARDAKDLARLLENEYLGLKFDLVFDKTFYMALNDENAQEVFFIAVALAGLVMLLFLGELLAIQALFQALLGLLEPLLRLLQSVTGILLRITHPCSFCLIHRLSCA